jgi:aminoglycoside phosphotransferase
MGLLLNVRILTILLSREVHVQKQCKQQLFVRIAATQTTNNGIEQRKAIKQFFLVVDHGNASLPPIIFRKKDWCKGFVRKVTIRKSELGTD